MAKLTEEDIRRLTEEAIRQMGESATSASVEQVVKEAVNRIDREPQEVPNEYKAIQQDHTRRAGNRIIVTAFGKNHPGILYGITGVVAVHGCDIVDLTQKILQEFFTMMLLVDISGCDVDFETIKDELVRKGEELDLKVIVQHEEIFNTMHRV